VDAELDRTLAAEDLESVLDLTDRQLPLHRVRRAQPAPLPGGALHALHGRVLAREKERVRDEAEHVLDRALDACAGFEGGHAIASSRAAAIVRRAAKRASVSGSCAGR
jgi:hypothetical protein